MNFVWFAGLFAGLAYAQAEPMQLLRADEAVYHEDIGTIEPARHVSVLPPFRQAEK